MPLDAIHPTFKYPPNVVLLACRWAAGAEGLAVAVLAGGHSHDRAGRVGVADAGACAAGGKVSVAQRAGLGPPACQVT